MSELQRDSLVGVVCLVPGLGGGGVQEGRSLPVGLQQGEDEETADGLVCVNGGGGGVLYLVWDSIWRGLLEGGGITYSCVSVQMGEEFEKGWKSCFG